MPKRKNYDKGAVDRLFAAQDGLATRAQLIELGVPPSTIRHRERPGGPWRRVLKGVCASHEPTLAGFVRLRAALLFAGPGSVVTGFAALRAHGITAVGAGEREERVKVLIPGDRRRSCTGFVLVARTRRLPEPVRIEGCRIAPVARAAVDACLDTRDTELIRRIVGELVHTGRSSPGELRAELDAHQMQRSAPMRAVLVEFAEGIRTGAQAQCRRRLQRVSAPAPQWNRVVIEKATGRVAPLPGALWPNFGVALEVGPEHGSGASGSVSASALVPVPGPAPAPGRARVSGLTDPDRAAVRRRWMAAVLRLTVAHVTPSQVRDRWDEVWAELSGLLNRPPTYRLPPGYAFG